MSEQVLYRKYRPGSFKELIGQEHVAEALAEAIKTGKVAHAYLFVGPRGTGKTSTARIFAEALGTSPSDLYEIDAASNNGVEEIRALREAVQTLPFDSKYKVYIIDEMHMLSPSASNAFLKTLEEPPAHVIFILATTELHKVKETILSRCQVHVFRKPTQETLAKMASSVAKKEGIALEKDAAILVAMLGDGSFRDTHGVLQKVLSATKGEKVTAENVERVTGAPRATLVQDLIRAIVAKDVEKALGTVRTATKENLDIKLFIKLVLHELRCAMLARFSPEIKKELEAERSADELKFQEEIAKEVGTTIKSDLLKELIDVYEAIDHSYIPELPLELALIKLQGKAHD